MKQIIDIRIIFLTFALSILNLPEFQAYSQLVMVSGDMGIYSFLSEAKPLFKRNASKYYVDDVNGDDQNNGKSASKPWKSLDKVNSSDFIPGDRVLFIRGGIWKGQLVIKCAGKSNELIYFGPYGDTGKPKPAIIGGGMVDSPIVLDSLVSYLTLEGFSVTNFDGKDIYDGAEARRYGIKISAGRTVQTQINILNNEVYFIEGFSNHQKVGKPRGTTLDEKANNQYGNGAIGAHSRIMNELTISGNYIHDCTCTGILMAFSNTSNNLIIRSNSIYNVGSDGIEIWHSEKPVIELNAVINCGNNSGTAERTPGVLGFNGLAVCGLWGIYLNAPVYQYNYCEGTKRILWDGQPWDFDNGASGRGIYQYNFSRDNEGGFTLGGKAECIYRYNISYNDGSKQGGGQGYFNGAGHFYNNIFFRNDQKAFHFNKCIASFENNIFYTNSSDSTNYQQGRAFNNNCFYGHTPKNPGVSAILADPLLTDTEGVGKIAPGVILTLEDFRNFVKGFKLKSGSPCINAGDTVLNDGGIDLWGNKLYNFKPDIGVLEY